MQFRSTPKTTDLDEVEGILDQIDPGEFLLSVTSMGIDLQILQIHRGISANYRFLSGIMSDAIREQDPAFEYKGIDFDEWNCEMIGTVQIIEYSDILLLNAVDMDEHYSDHVIAETGWFEFFRGPVSQAFAIFLAGSSSRYNAAAYFGHFGWACSIALQRSERRRDQEGMGNICMKGSLSFCGRLLFSLPFRLSQP